MTEPDDEDLLPPIKKRWWRRPAVLVVVGVVLVAAAGFSVNTLLHACGGLGSGVTEIGGECVGVTDGSYVFDPTLVDVEKKIKTENDGLKEQSHTVTIALLNPLTADSTSALDHDEVRREVEGAYIAQHHVNQMAKAGDLPYIRLVLANEGSHERQWQPVVRQLKEMVGDAAPLVAVTGLGVSVTETLDGARELATLPIVIPMVAAITTADELRYTTTRGFIRVSPSNQEYVQSLSSYLEIRKELDSAILVSDSNADDPVSPDLYVRSLRDDLRSGMSNVTHFPAQSFTGQFGSSEVSPDLFRAITSNICAVAGQQQQPLKVVLFAGRKHDLRSFLASLADRVCPDAPLTVVTGGSDLGDLKRDEKMLQDKKITLAYAATTDPRGWADKVPGTPVNFADFRLEFSQTGFDVNDLDDGGAISNYDAVLAAVKAIRLVTAAAPPSSYRAPTPGDVLGQLLNLNTNNFVPGASGDLKFSYRGDDSGNPCGKPIPVLEIPSSGLFAAETGTTYVTCRLPP